MKLLFSIESLESGGAQRQLVTLAIGLARRGHQVEFFVYVPALDFFRSMLEAEQIRVHSHAKNSRYTLSPIRTIRRLANNDGFDAMLAFLGTPSFYCEIAKLGGRGTPLVVSERSTYSPQRMTVRKRILLNAHRLADHITVNSHQQFEHMVRDYPWMKPKMSVIYNGVDLQAFARPTRSVAENKELRLLAVGRVVKGKNATTLIESLSRFRARHGHNPTVTWIGRHQDPVYFGQCNELLQQARLVDSWRWLAERKDITELYRQHDALIHPSLYEGCPNAICEAMACGLPILAGRVGDHERFITDAESGFLFDPASAHSVDAALQRFCALSTEQRMTMGRNSRSVAEREFSPSRLVDAYQALFQRLTEKNPTIACS